MNRSNSIVLHDSFAFKGGGERLGPHPLSEDWNWIWPLANDRIRGLTLMLYRGSSSTLKIRSHLWGWRTVQRFYSFTLKTRFLKNYESVIYSGQNSPYSPFATITLAEKIFIIATRRRAPFTTSRTTGWLPCLSLQRLSHRAFNLCFQPLFESAIDKMDHYCRQFRQHPKKNKKISSKKIRWSSTPRATPRAFTGRGRTIIISHSPVWTQLKRVDISRQSLRTNCPTNVSSSPRRALNWENLKKWPKAVRTSLLPVRSMTVN